MKTTMPKRFSATEKWDKEWFQRLTPKHKLLWYYLFEKCDHAGIWETNFHLATILIGEPVVEQDMEVFGDRVEKLPDGKWWLTKFVEFQYGELHASSPMHRSVVSKLAKYGLLERVSTPYRRGGDTPKDRDKDTAKVGERGVGGEVSVGYPAPLDCPEFRKAWEEYRAHRFQIRKPLTAMSESKALIHLDKLARSDLATALKIVEQSIANGWQGLFELRENGNGHNSNKPNNPNSQIARATFRHGEQQVKNLKDLEATLIERDRQRNQCP